MSFRSSLAALVALLVALAALDAEAQAPAHPGMREPERYHLDNGLEVVLDALPERHAIAVCVNYHVGTRDQRRGWTGLAHLTEHLMFEGSAHLEPDQYWREVERAGGIDRNATTGADDTTYWAVVPSTEIERMLWLESDRMGYLLARLDSAAIDAQRAVVARERAERIGLRARSGVPRIVSRVLFADDHPYREVEELPADLDAITLPHVQRWVQDYYAPDNATLAISGGFDPAVVRPMVERWFGSLRRTAPARPRATPRYEQLAEARDVVLEAHTTTDELHLYWPTPAFGAPGDAELDVAARILTRRLRAVLVESGIALAVAAWQSSRDLASEASVSVLLPAGRGTEQARVLVEREIARLAREAPEEDLVVRYRTMWLDDLAHRLESLAGRAGFFSMHSQSFPGGHWSIAADAQRYSSITAEAVRATVREWMPLDRRLAITIVSRSDAEEGGRILDERSVPAAPGGAR